MALIGVLSTAVMSPRAVGVRPVVLASRLCPVLTRLCSRRLVPLLPVVEVPLVVTVGKSRVYKSTVFTMGDTT